jgi:DNA invertase Pin-like site-specific DNA recombinase
MLIGYARVSTRDQKSPLQIDALREAGCERIFKETISGAGRDRPELKTALDFIRMGDSLVVWKLDRLAYSTRQLLETVGVLEQRGIGLKVLTQQMDTASAGGHLIFTVFSAIAEFEREIILERTRAGLDAARSRGHKGGRPRVLSDKDLKEARALLTDPEITVEDVARRLGVGPSTLYRYLPAARHAVQETLSHS